MTTTATIAPTVSIPSTVRIIGNGTLLIHDYVTIEDYVTFDLGPSDRGVIEIAPRAKLKQGVILRAYSGNISIGSRVSVGEYSVLSGHGGLDIASHTIIAGHCYFAPSQHIMDGEVPIRYQGETFAGISLGEGVWLGAHVTVQDDVKIGTGAVVGSGSVVTRSLPAGTVCYGVPCRARRPREILVEKGSVLCKR